MNSLYTKEVKRKTTIEIDDDLLLDAQVVLGTKGLKATVDQALMQVVRAGRRRALADQLENGEGLDFGETTRDAARRWRT